MKRPLLLALAVLVPFIALVALGLRALEEQPPVLLPTPPAPALPPVGEPAAVAAPAPLPAAPAAPTPVAVAPTPAAPPAPSPTEPKRELRAEQEPEEEPLGLGVPKEAIAAVEPLVAQCFTDSAEGKRKRSPPKATVSFTVLDSGRFERVRVQRQSWPDPQLTACLEDAFADARFEGTLVAPRSDANRHFLYTFRVGRPDAGSH